MKNSRHLSEQLSPAKNPAGLLKSLVPASTKSRIYLMIAVLVVIVFATLPAYVDVDNYFMYFLFICFTYIVISQGWNLVGGYTGQISLGTHAFFALGGYTTALIWIHDITKTYYYFDPLVMLLSGIVPAIFALIIGIPLLSRLRGDYFSFGTLAAAEVLRIVILRTTEFSGGAVGLRLPGSSFTGMALPYGVALALAVLATLTVLVITRSRIGLSLRAISEDETASASHGINILRYKLLSFAIGSFIIGICGSLYAYYYFIVNPGSMMSLNLMFYPILICVLGGNGTILGPIIGAPVVAALFTFGQNVVGQIHPMLSGVLIILVMKFLPTGLVGLKARISPRR
jgi:branched-chain amino acid transport system permease protein